MKTTRQGPREAFWVCRDRFDNVRIRPVNVVAIDRGAGTARVELQEAGRRIARSQPVPFAELASRPGKAVRLAMALMPASRAKLRAAGAEPHPWQRGSAQVMAKLNFPPPARPIEHGNKCTKTAPAAEQF